MNKPNFSELLIDPMYMSEVWDGYSEFPDSLDMLDRWWQEIVVGKLPKGHKWKFLWCSEAENGQQADDLASLLLSNNYGHEYMIYSKLGEYVTGNWDNGKDWVAWFSWGIGCPLQSACSEIWVAVEVNEDGTEKYPPFVRSA